MGAPDAPRTSTCIALPYVSKTGFSGPTLQSIIYAIAERGFRDCRFAFFGDFSQVGARNAACRVAIDWNMDYLLFIDSDMDFPVDMLERLKACDADVACTDMWSRNWPSFRTVMRLGPTDEKGMRKSLPYEGHGVESVDVCGMACTLIKTSLLRRMPDPWFVAGTHGEDAAFCFVAKEKYGATIKCDYGITAGHWGTCRMAGQDFTRDAANQPMSLDDPEMMARMGARNVELPHSGALPNGKGTLPGNGALTSLPRET